MLGDRLEGVVAAGLIAETYDVSARATYYPEKIKVFVPFSPYLKGLKSKTKPGKKIGNSSDDDKEHSISRTRAAVRDYVLCNRFDLFITFTFREDREDVDRCKSKMANWLKNQQKRKGKFGYIIVPEFHKDQKAIHFHALFKNYPGELELAINPNTGRQVKAKGKTGGTVYTLKSYRLGYSNAQRVGDSSEDYAKVANYVRKYITKDMPVFLNKNRYWVSQGLKTPIYEENPEWYKDATPTWTKVTERGRIYMYSRDAGIVPEGMWD